MALPAPRRKGLFNSLSKAVPLHLLHQAISTQSQLLCDSGFVTSLQRAANEIVTRHARALGLQGIHNAAALLVDNRSFEVLAYVGNAEWSVANESGFAVDIVHRPRSSGSILKPFLFAAMLQADFLRHLGMTTITRPPEDYGLTLILGGAEATVWDMTGMYANLADLARHPRSGPTATYRRLKILQHEDISTDRLPEIGPGAAWLTLNALLEVARPGEKGHWRNFTNSHKIAWKTGTSFGHRDAWVMSDN